MAAGDDRIDGQEFEHEAGEPLETERLALDEEDRLPWLESGDDEFYEDEGSDSKRMLAFVLMGLVALAAIIGGIWWATNRKPDPALVADGSTIAAPDTPYKDVPKDAGGKKLDGTGDSTFAVSEGQSQTAKLGDGTPVPKADGAVAAATGSAAAPAGGVGVQVGAYSSQAAAEAGWSRLQGQHAALSGVAHRIVQGQADIGTVFRLQAVPGDAAAANALCGKLKSAGVSCQIK